MTDEETIGQRNERRLKTLYNLEALVRAQELARPGGAPADRER